MRKATFIFEKAGSRLRLCGKAQQNMYDAWLDSVPDGLILSVVYSKKRHEKTLSQLGYWYGVLMPFGCEVLREAGYDELFEVGVGELKAGVETTPNTTDLLFKTLFAAHKSLKGMPLKRDMTDEEMGQLIDFTMAWLAKNLGAVAPEPEK